jgi:hypothetical protein
VSQSEIDSAVHAPKLAARDVEGFCNRPRFAIVVLGLHGDGDCLDKRNRTR